MLSGKLFEILRSLPQLIEQLFGFSAPGGLLGIRSIRRRANQNVTRTALFRLFELGSMLVKIFTGFVSTHSHLPGEIIKRQHDVFNTCLFRQPELRLMALIIRLDSGIVGFYLCQKLLRLYLRKTDFTFLFTQSHDFVRYKGGNKSMLAKWRNQLLTHQFLTNTGFECPRAHSLAAK